MLLSIMIFRYSNRAQPPSLQSLEYIYILHLHRSERLITCPIILVSNGFLSS